MNNEELKRQVEAFAQWKKELTNQIGAYQEWLEENAMSSPESELRIFEILETLRSDRVTIAFVAEVASGKTELINAIFFSEYKRRLLPSEAGRTTMCPTELLYDSKEEQPYLRLLPIETRLEDTSIAEYKRNPIEWSTIKLDIDSPDNMVEALREVTAVKTVTVDEAKRLGLYDQWQHPDIPASEDSPTHVEIPVWRHAVISFPHPLLQQGLVVLDTPGLNALGSEPELTLNMLPNAQAVLFLLAADTGVRKSELEMWQHHIRLYRTRHRKGLLVVLNKIDTLWDELKDADDVRRSIADQCSKTSDMLGVPVENVFPASAQKALLARVKDDEDLLTRSGILALENTLAQEVLPEKQRILRENIVADVSGMIETTQDILRSRCHAARKQYAELSALSGKNADVIAHLLRSTRAEQIAYNNNVESLQTSRRAMSVHATRLLDHLSLQALDTVVERTRKEMSGSWTTHGLKTGMKVFFDHVQSSMIDGAEQAEQTRRVVLDIFRKFHKDHGLPEIRPREFSTQRYVAELERLYEEAAAFRDSPFTLMTEQSYVVQKFFISLVSRARNIFFNARHDAEVWAKSVMSPLISQIRDHRKEIERRLDTLRKVTESRDTLQGRLDELKATSVALEREIARLDTIVQTVNRPLAVEQAAGAEAKPPAVSA